MFQKRAAKEWLQRFIENYIDSYRFIEYSQRAYVTSILAVKDGMC